MNTFRYFQYFVIFKTKKRRKKHLTTLFSRPFPFNWRFHLCVHFTKNQISRNYGFVCVYDGNIDTIQFNCYVHVCVYLKLSPSFEIWIVPTRLICICMCVYDVHKKYVAYEMRVCIRLYNENIVLTANDFLLKPKTICMRNGSSYISILYAST